MSTMWVTPLHSRTSRVPAFNEIGGAGLPMRQQQDAEKPSCHLGSGPGAPPGVPGGGMTGVELGSGTGQADFRNDIYVPLCYDAEGSKSFLKVIMDVATLRIQGFRTRLPPWVCDGETLVRIQMKDSRFANPVGSQPPLRDRWPLSYSRVPGNNQPTTRHCY